MVIRGRTRGNGRQLAAYLLAQGENEYIRILDIAGRDQTHGELLHRTLLSMSFTSELTKSDKGLYHVQINPAYHEDRRMDREAWIKAADILEKELGLTDQRRVIVLHTKKGRTHAHVVWERYDHDKGIMISDSFSRLAQDRARKEMERVFNQQKTPHRNEQRPEMKKHLTELWHKTKSGKEFIIEAGKAGYVIAAGLQRRPFMVVDSTGRSFDLVRQLDKVKTKDIRERLKGEKLIAEKDAITHMRGTRKKEPEAAPKEAERIPANDNARNARLAQEFAAGRSDMLNAEPKDFAQRQEEATKGFQSAKDDMARYAQNSEAEQARRKRDEEQKIQQEKNQTAARNFAANRNDALSPEEEREKKRQKILEQLRQARLNQDHEHER